MESTTEQSMLKILNECLKASNLETVSKAELRKKYLEKTGLTKLPQEDKKSFSSAVKAAFLNYISNKTATAEKIKINEAADNEIKETSEDWKLVMSSSSSDEITPENIKENVINDLFTNEENDIKKISGDGIKENGDHEKLITDSSPDDNIPARNKHENVIDEQFGNGVYDIEMESSCDFDEKSVLLHKNNIKKPPLDSTLNRFNRQRGKRTLISSSEDETIQLESTKRNKVLKKARRSNDLEVLSITYSEKNKKVSISKDGFKKAIVESSGSEEEPLSIFQKKKNSLSGSLNSSTKSDESEDESIMSSNKKKSQFINDLNDGKMIIKAKLVSNGSQESMKSKNNSSDSEDEPLTKFRKSNDSIPSDKNENLFTKRKLNSSGKFSKSFESTSGSEDDSLAKYSKKKVNNSIDSDEAPLTTFIKKSESMNNSLKSVKISSDSEDEPLNNLSRMKINNSNDYKKKTVEKIVEKKVKLSLKNPIKDNSKSKQKTLNKKRFVDSDDDSDEQPIATFAKKPDSFKCSLNSVKDSSDSEDDGPLNHLSNKKKNNSYNSVKEPVEKIVKVKHSLKKPISSDTKSKEQTLKKKRFVDSDENAITSNKEKDKSFDEQRDSLLSDSCEDEPLSNITKKPKDFSSSEDDAIKSNGKKEKSIDEQKNFLLSDSSEDELLSPIKRESKRSSDSEDEPLNKLSSKQSDKKQKNSESGSSSFVDENEELSSKKNKPLKRKEAKDSGKQGKKRPSASENKIEHLKKYLRVAGIRISNYNKLFENCKTTKAKCEKMMSLLEKEGLKGRPTLEKCKKLRVKIETKREIAELDMSNILKEGGGRPKRSVCLDTTNCTQEEKSTPIKKFSRLQDIVDSEESD